MTYPDVLQVGLVVCVSSTAPGLSKLLWHQRGTSQRKLHEEDGVHWRGGTADRHLFSVRSGQYMEELLLKADPLQAEEVQSHPKVGYWNLLQSRASTTVVVLWSFSTSTKPSPTINPSNRWRHTPIGSNSQTTEYQNDSWLFHVYWYQSHLENLQYSKVMSLYL